MPVPTPANPVAPVRCSTEAAGKPPKPKKIFVFCDGTGNKFVRDHFAESGNSNVVKLYTTLRVADNQVAYYHPGVGTMGDPTIRSAVGRFWSEVKGLAFGAGFQANVLDAYQYLMETYNDGDEIYLFGFSRGAYTARAVAGMLHGYGLLCRGNERHLLYAWNMFRADAKRSRELLKQEKAKRGAKGRVRAHSIAPRHAFAETYSRRVTIRFMGIWDTVSSVGWIYTPLRLLDMAQNPIVQVGRHAVSIDERRAYYRDNLWGPPIKMRDPRWPQEFREQGIRQDIVQVWFPGMHSDVGGSYPQPESAPANETLAWMIGELQQHGAQLCQERIAMVLGTRSGAYSADGIYTPAPRKDERLHDSLRGVWWVLQGFPQQYYSKEDEKIELRVPYGTPRSVPAGSIIHGSAVRRLRKTMPGQMPYRPANLQAERLRPIGNFAKWTTADLSGCSVYRPARTVPANSGRATRYGRLALGYLALTAFFALLAAIGWIAVCVAVLLLVLLVWVVMHMPGIRSLVMRS